jgi:MFS family permease
MALSKSVVYILLVFCIFLMCSSLSVVTPFFPPYAMEKGVSEEIVGLIISSNPIGAFFASLYLGKILDEVTDSGYLPRTTATST